MLRYAPDGDIRGKVNKSGAELMAPTTSEQSEVQFLPTSSANEFALTVGSGEAISQELDQEAGHPELVQVLAEKGNCWEGCAAAAELAAEADEDEEREVGGKAMEVMEGMNDGYGRAAGDDGSKCKGGGGDDAGGRDRGRWRLCREKRRS